VSRLSPVSHREFIRRLRTLGFTGPFSGGRHPFMLRGGRAYHVPNPHHGDIGVPLLRRVLKQLGVTPTEWASAS